MSHPLNATNPLELDSAENLAAPKPYTWKDFVYITKPGILFSNLMTVFGGFWLASRWEIDGLLLLWILLGSTLVMASGCVLNNYLDREMDTKMSRTKKRALPSGRLQAQTVFAYGVVLGLVGLVMLYTLVNPLTAVLGLIGLLVYVVVYTAWLKRTSVWCTTVGAISGAMPPVMGYVAVTGKFDMNALLLFGILFLWQPPHFWALGIRRKEEYRAAGFPMLPVVRGTHATRISMIRYAAPLIPVSLMPYLYGSVGVVYLVAAAALGIGWLVIIVKGFKETDENLWAKKVFVYSINYLMVLFIVMVLDTTGGFLSNLF
ncbi:heme o synthase [Gorillibacterium timonense]|uniref:heme o synthase n=1 Tax=Gorillibacterium timonense TaxID=1689269 RepID=UPI00071CC40E|nr:heme o synthase [Gorillibacterium timonense]